MEEDRDIKRDLEFTHLTSGRPASNRGKGN